MVLRQQYYTCQYRPSVQLLPESMFISLGLSYHQWFDSVLMLLAISDFCRAADWTCCRERVCPKSTDTKLRCVIMAFPSCLE